MLLRLYGWLWTLARPLLRRHKRLRDGFDWRLVPADWAGGIAPVDVWFQAASGGEAYLAWSVAESLLAKTQGRQHLLFTTWTLQGLEVLQGMKLRLAEVYPEAKIRVVFFPLDSPTLMRRALEQARPRVVALLETELWPSLMYACAERGIPLVVLNGRMTEKSFAQYQRVEQWSAGFWRKAAPVRIAAMNAEDASRFGELFGRERVQVVPNIKFDRAETVPAQPDAALEQLLPPASRDTVVLLASVREEEEEAVLGVIRHLRGAGRPLRILLAPRHLHRVSPWQERLARDGIRPLLRSACTDPLPEGSVVIWNTFGELGQLYSLARAVFVGGSLAPLGGQNFLEALAAGRTPCCGPSLTNFSWALGGTEGDSEAHRDTLERRGLLTIARNAQEVAASLRTQLDDPRTPDARRALFLDWLAPRLGGAGRSAALLLECLNVSEKRIDASR